MIEHENAYSERGSVPDDVSVGFYDVDDTDSLLVSVVETASRLGGTNELHFPALEDSIDLESLQVVIRSLDRSGAARNGYVEFEHDDLTVQIHVNGMIVVRRDG